MGHVDGEGRSLGGKGMSLSKESSGFRTLVAFATSLKIILEEGGCGSIFCSL